MFSVNATCYKLEALRTNKNRNVKYLMMDGYIINMPKNVKN